MVGPLVVLAAGAALAGFLGFPGDLLGRPEWNLLAHWLEPSLGKELEIPHGIEISMMVSSVLLAAAGAAIAWVFYGGGYRAPARAFAAAAPWLVSLVRDKFRVDELYDFLIVRPIKFLARGLFVLVDRILIDRVLVHGSVLVVDLFGRIARLFQAGDAQRYVAVFALGIAALFLVVRRPARPDELKVKVEGNAVEADASTGSSAPSYLIYGFDFDGDGRFDRQGRSPTAHWTYEGVGAYTIRVVVKDERWGTLSSLEKRVVIR
jgi:hypothetical protein